MPSRIRSTSLVTPAAASAATTAGASFFQTSGMSPSRIEPPGRGIVMPGACGHAATAACTSPNSVHSGWLPLSSELPSPNKVSHSKRQNTTSAVSNTTTYGWPVSTQPLRLCSASEGGRGHPRGRQGMGPAGPSVHLGGRGGLSPLGSAGCLGRAALPCV